MTSSASPSKLGRDGRWLLLAAVLLAVSVVGYRFGVGRQVAHSAVQERGPLSPETVDVVALRVAWEHAAESVAPDARSLATEAVRPVDDYFEHRALAGIESFVEEMGGIFKSFGTMWARTQDWWSGPDQATQRTRVEMRVEDALERHLGMTGELERAIGDAGERFTLLQSQADARFRSDAYSLLQGAGLRVDPSRLAALHEQARTRALSASLREIGVDQAEALSTGTLSAMATSTLADIAVTGAVTAAFSASAAGGAGGGGAIAAGAGTGGAAGSIVPGAGTLAGLAAGAIVGTLVYMVADDYFKDRASEELSRGVGEMQTEVHDRLSTFFEGYARELHHQRLGLLDAVLASEGSEP